MSFRRKFPQAKHVSSNQSRISYSKDVFKIHALLNTYLRFHGLATAGKCEMSCKNLVLFAISTIFIVINEISRLYYMIHILVQLFFSKNKRSESVLTVLVILDYLLRILFFTKRNKLADVTRRMKKLYSAIIPQINSRCAINLTLMLIINDICSLFAISYIFIQPNSSFIIEHANNFVFRYLSASISKVLIYFSIFMDLWGSVIPFIPVYFCCFCFALEQIINKFKKLLQKNSNFYYLNEVYAELLNLTPDINEVFHDMLLLVIIIQLGFVFFHSYNMLTGKTSVEFLLTYRIPMIVITFIRFVIICMFASSVSKAGSELRRNITNVHVKDDDRWEYLRLAIKTNENFVEFKLLDSLVIDRNLILSSVGSIVSYGIIIATFNVNSNN